MPCTTITASTGYHGLAKQLVTSLKFLGKQSAARIMAEHMATRLLPAPTVILTHMPATTSHIRQRGYDQAELITYHLARLTGCRRLTLLARSGQQHQLGSKREQRLSQLTRALRVKHASRISGKHIIVIDDVLTTGSSVRAAATVLVAAGAARVDVLTFAQAYVPEH